jgi:carboxyl-terminal processing protease
MTGWTKIAAAMALGFALGGCGGGGDAAAPAACDVTSQKAWLRDYLADWYYWSGSATLPDPVAYPTVESYFDAALYAGAGAVPADRWSYIEDSVRYNSFFGEGRTLGYGVSVNGLELTLPLKVRYVDPGSPAEAAGVKRGDVIVSLDGRPAADIVAANDFTVLTPDSEGQVLQMVLQDGAGTRSVALTALTYDLVPVPTTRVLTLSNGTKAGYLVMKDFIVQAEGALAAAFLSFRQQGATELILDLRYNGGGRLSTANALASLVSGASHGGSVFTQLRYNASHAGSNTVFRLGGTPGPAFSRVVVLTGPRTCSASELIVNGLVPYANVVTIGGATCGKPFGFNPVEHCGKTYSAVNFETFNGLNQGQYYNGIAPTCDVADDFSGELGADGEKLLVAATGYLQNGVCPAVSMGQARALGASPLRGLREPGDRPGTRPQ